MTRGAATTRPFGARLRSRGASILLGVLAPIAGAGCFGPVSTSSPQINADTLGLQTCSSTTSSTVCALARAMAKRAVPLVKARVPLLPTNGYPVDVALRGSHSPYSLAQATVPPCVRLPEWIDNVPNAAVEDDASMPVLVGLATIDDHGVPLSAEQFSGTVTAIPTPDGLARLMERDASLGRPDFTPIIVAGARCVEGLTDCASRSSP